MGSGKTQGAINLMNSQPETNFIFITPYLSEIERIKKSCPDRRFYDPLNHGKGKLESFHKLLLDEKNICTTHALFKMSNNTTRELIASGNYTLILDEVVDVVEQVHIHKKDLNNILEKYARIENDFLIWLDEDYPDTGGEFSKYKIMAHNKSLVVHNGSMLMWNFPVDSFPSFNDVYVLTYLFNAQPQRYYFDLYNLKYSYYIAHINDNTGLYEIIKKPSNISYKEMKQFLKDNVKVCSNEKLNSIGDDNSLSHTWFSRKSDSKLVNKMLINKLRNNTENYFRNIIKGTSNENMWTCFQDTKGLLKGKGYTKGFVSCNARATNEYSHKKNLAYLINRYQNPILEQFFKSKDVCINQDDYALSELVQWIWRSAIRNQQPINIYIPSERMRKLFINWLEDESK